MLKLSVFFYHNDSCAVTAVRSLCHIELVVVYTLETRLNNVMYSGTGYIQLSKLGLKVGRRNFGALPFNYFFQILSLTKDTSMVLNDMLLFVHHLSIHISLGRKKMLFVYLFFNACTPRDLFLFSVAIFCKSGVCTCGRTP